MELDAIGHILLATPGACEILGRTEAQLIGEPVERYCSDYSRHDFKKLLQDLAVHPRSHPRIIRCRLVSGVARLRLSAICQEESCTGYMLLIEREEERAEGDTGARQIVTSAPETKPHSAASVAAEE